MGIYKHFYLTYPFSLFFLLFSYIFLFWQLRNLTTDNIYIYICGIKIMVIVSFIIYVETNIDFFPKDLHGQTLFVTTQSDKQGVLQEDLHVIWPLLFYLDYKSHFSNPVCMGNIHVRARLHKTPSFFTLWKI